MRKTFTSFLFLLLMTAATAMISAQDGWVKLGEKDVDFSVDHDNVGAESKGKIREIRVAVMHAPVKFKKVVFNYKDGEKREIEFLEEVEVGKYSSSITIEGDGHAIKSVDFWYETSTMGGKKAKIAIYGRG